MSQTSEGTTVIVDGRLVWCVAKTPFEGRKKTIFGTQQPDINPNTGEQKVEFGFGLAVPKTVLGQPGPDGKIGIWNALHGEAMKLFPNGQIPPSFAMKYKDGDTAVDEKGVPYSKREGYAGHIVLACTTRLPIKFFRHENGQAVQIADGIKNGDYVRVQLHIKSHPAQGAGKAGLYVNPNAVMFLGYGTEIINTPSGDDIFGTQALPLPPGASATPLAPTNAAFPAAPVTAPVMPPTYAPPQPAAAPAHYGVLPPSHQPPPGGMPIAQPAYAPPPAPPQYPQQPTFPSHGTTMPPIPQ